MFRRVAVAHDHLPVVFADTQHIARQQAVKLLRHGRHQFGIVRTAHADFFQRFGIGETVGAEKRHRTLAAINVALGSTLGEHAGGDVLRHGHEQRYVQALAQPGRQPHVIGMHVGDDDPQYRQTLEFGFENLPPITPEVVPRHAAIDDGPAITSFKTIAQQPEIDVVEGEGQRHAHPAQPGLQLVGTTKNGECVPKGILELAFEGIHQGHPGGIPSGAGRLTVPEIERNRQP